VTAAGDVVTIGWSAETIRRADLGRIIVGGEGTLGIVDAPLGCAEPHPIFV